MPWHMLYKHDVPCCAWFQRGVQRMVCSAASRKAGTQTPAKQLALGLGGQILELGLGGQI
jgi:hypothetical protein